MRANCGPSGKGKSGSIVDGDPERYRRFGEAALPLAAPAGEARRRRWRRFRRRGKTLSLVRLAKATTTFAGGVDYLAWKINRHAGTQIVVKPWQRRWPIIGGAYSAASSAAAGRDPLVAWPLIPWPLMPPSAASTAAASALTVNGFLSTAWPARSPASPASPT